jgi:radical SAM superfamily enzyme YgiQ (UPF0313 family)
MIPCVRLIFPPQFEPFQPYLAGPYLKSLLAQIGIVASAFDANLGFYEWLIWQASGGVQWPTAGDGHQNYLRSNVKKAVTLLRREPASLPEYRWAVNVIDQYLEAISPTGAKLGLTYLKVGNRYSSRDFSAYLDRPDNLFIRYFEHASESILGAVEVSTYLLSVVVIDQLAAAVSFAREIRRRRKGARIIVGGPLVSRLYRQLRGVPEICDAFDAIAPGEAPRILPQMFGLQGNVSAHVTPDFSDYDLDRYWSCRRVLPYLVAHGCKWGKCTFCSHHLTYDGYRSSAMSEVLSDLEHLAQIHRVEYISFSDEYLTPSQLDDLSSGILQRGLDIRWSTFARPEPAFRDTGRLARLYEAGCRMLMFGMESGSQRVINGMRKGTRVQHFRPILEACKAANIAVRCDFMVGFPGETEDEAEVTYEFVRRNRDVIDTPFSSYAVAAFELRSGIPIEQEPERYRIVPRKALRGDLDDQYEFENEQGLNERSRASWREKLIHFAKTELDTELICPQNKTHQLVLKDLYDQRIFDLPVVRVDMHSLSAVEGRLSPGVDVSSTAGGFLVTNHANGGQLQLSPGLGRALEQLSHGTNLADAMRTQDLWPAATFAQFVSFLYRNDYLLLWIAAPSKTMDDRNWSKADA